MSTHDGGWATLAAVRLTLRLPGSLRRAASIAGCVGASAAEAAGAVRPGPAGRPVLAPGGRTADWGPARALPRRPAAGGGVHRPAADRRSRCRSAGRSASASTSPSRPGEPDEYRRGPRGAGRAAARAGAARPPGWPRYRAGRRRCPGTRLAARAGRAVRRCCATGRALVPLPAGEAVSFRVVDDAPWSALHQLPRRVPVAGHGERGSPAAPGAAGPARRARGLPRPSHRALPQGGRAGRRGCVEHRVLLANSPQSVIVGGRGRARLGRRARAGLGIGWSPTRWPSSVSASTGSWPSRSTGRSPGWPGSGWTRRCCCTRRARRPSEVVDHLRAVAAGRRAARAADVALPGASGVAGLHRDLRRGHRAAASLVGSRSGAGAAVAGCSTSR